MEILFKIPRVKNSQKEGGFIHQNLTKMEAEGNMEVNRENFGAPLSQKTRTEILFLVLLGEQNKRNQSYQMMKLTEHEIFNKK